MVHCWEEFERDLQTLKQFQIYPLTLGSLSTCEFSHAKTQFQRSGTWLFRRGLAFGIKSMNELT